MKNFLCKLFNKKNEKKIPVYYMSDEPDDLTVLEDPKYKPRTYQVSPLENWRIEKFKNEHEEVCHTKGYGYSIMFSNSSGIGYNISCVCGKCGKQCDVTDVSNW